MLREALQAEGTPMACRVAGQRQGLGAARARSVTASSGTACSASDGRFARPWVWSAAFSQASATAEDGGQCSFR